MCLFHFLLSYTVTLLSVLSVSLHNWNKTETNNCFISDCHRNCFISVVQTALHHVFGSRFITYSLIRVSQSSSVESSLLLLVIFTLHSPGCHYHRHMSLGGLQPPLTWAKPLFFGQKPAAKNEKKNLYFVFIKRKKTEFIPPSKIKCPKSGIFTNNYWVVWVGQSNLQVRSAVFRALSRKIFRAKMAQPPPRKLTCMPMVIIS